MRITGDDRAGLERLLRYCARPAFALDRLAQVDPERVVYRLPEPQPDGRTALSLNPLELPIGFRVVISGLGWLNFLSVARAVDLPIPIPQSIPVGALAGLATPLSAMLC